MSKNPTLVPGMIVPGRPSRLKNDKVTEYNDLTRAGLERPQMLQAMAKHLSYECGMLSQILMYTGREFNERMLSSKMLGAEKLAILRNNFQFIDSYRFMFNVGSPKHKMITFVKDPSVNDIFVGKLGKPFKVYINDVHVDKDDVILLSDLRSNLMIISQPVRHAKHTELTVRLNFANNNHAVHRTLVSKGAFAKRSTNYKTERSTHGSRFEMSSNDMAMGSMSTHRFQTDQSGHASVVKNNIEWFSYMFEDGTVGTYWIDIWKYKMLKESWKFIENQLFTGVAPRNPDGSFYADAQTGKKFIAGDGMLHQCRSMLRKAYNNMSLGLFEDLAYELKKDSIGNIDGDLEFVFLGGMKAVMAFTKMVKKELGGTYSPNAFYYTDAYGNEGYKSKFNVLELPFAKIYIAQTDYFDQKWMPTQTMANGDNLNSHRAYLLNISRMQGGEENVSLVTIPGRDMIQGRVAGMANPGNNGVLSTTEDVEGHHLMRTAGIAVHNPNCLAEIYKPAQYV
ncbi:MAG: hypothetical protein AB8G11_02395 [Saprospiraceae bacterium]